MPRCPAHCPPETTGPLPAAAIIAGVLVLTAAGTVIAHLLTIVMITLGVAAGLGITGLVIRVLAAHAQDTPARLQARAVTLRAAQATDGLRQITSSRGPAAGDQPPRGAGHRGAPAIEQHWHLHLHAASDEQ